MEQKCMEQNGIEYKQNKLFFDRTEQKLEKEELLSMTKSKLTH